MSAKLVAEDPVVRATYAALQTRGLDDDEALKEIQHGYLAVWQRLWFGRVNLSNERRALFNAAMHRLAGGGRADDLLDDERGGHE